MTQKIPAAFQNIMIIDDNEMDLYITAQTIKRSNTSENVLPYTQGSEAIKYLQASACNLSLLPKIILVDIYMPGMSGFEFMEAYNELPATLKAFCKVFILSSSIDHEDLLRANKDINIAAFRGKPVSKDFLYNLSQSYSCVTQTF